MLSPKQIYYVQISGKFTSMSLLEMTSLQNQLAITCSKLATETLEQDEKYVQS